MDAIKRGDLIRVSEITSSPDYPINTSLTETGLSALAFACSWSTDEQVFQIILEQSPDVNHRDSDGQTPLHVAALNKNLTAIKVLL